MLDFPDSPNEGDTHSEADQIWTYLSGAWVMGGSKTSSQTIVEDDTTAGWQVVGDVLMQWGVEPGGVTTERTVTFPIGFADTPVVEAIPNNPDTQVPRFATANAITSTGFTTRVRASDATYQPDPVGWVAYGEAPDNLKQPKTVVVGGAKQGGMEVVPLWVGVTQTDVTLSDSYLNYDLLMWETQENTGRYHMHQIDPARFSQFDGGANNVWSARASDANTTRSYEIYPQDETTIIMNSRTGMDMTGFYGLRFAVPDKQVPVTGQETVIVEDDAATGYQVVGDILIQWGTALMADLPGGRLVLTYPQPFKDGTLPTITGTAAAGSSAVTVTVHTGTTFDHLGCALDARFGNTNALVSVDLRWIAIGEAPDALKKPKSVITGGGIAEYHDPTGAGSWRIIGTTLECWGEETVSQIGDGAITTFPKTFARPPTVVATPKAKPGGQAVRTLTIQEASTTQFEHWTTDSNGNTGDPLDRVTWHAIGEWDGVS